MSIRRPVPDDVFPDGAARPVPTDDDLIDAWEIGRASGPLAGAEQAFLRRHNRGARLMTGENWQRFVDAWRSGNRKAQEVGTW